MLIHVAASKIFVIICCAWLFLACSAVAHHQLTSQVWLMVQLTYWKAVQLRALKQMQTTRTSHYTGTTT